MLQYINLEIDNSHFCDSRGVLLLYVRIFLRTVYEKIHTETSVQLWSNIKVIGM